MRKSIYISLVLVMVMQSWVGGFWSVRTASAKSSMPAPAKKAPLSCCATPDRSGMTAPDRHRIPSPPIVPCKCPDTENDCCCLRAMAVNGGFVFGTTTPPTMQPLRESDHSYMFPIPPVSQVLFVDRDENSGTSPPIFKLKGCFQI